MTANQRTGRAPAAVKIAGVSVLLLAAVLIFFRLDDRLLWVDEAETALLARSVLVHGIPVAFDGTNLISQEVGKEFGANYVWRWTPWLDKYVTAAAFAVLGETTFSARLPFALIGLLSVASLYALALRLFADRWTAVLAMLCLVLSVPFLLHVRQCRYYAPIILATIWAIYFVVGVVRGNRWSVAGLVGAMTVIFHSNVLTSFATGAALVSFAFVIGLDRSAVKRGAVAAGWVVALNAPAAYFLMSGKSGEHLLSFWANLRGYVSLTARYTLPVGAVVVFLVLAWVCRRRHQLLDAPTTRPFLALLSMFPVMILVLSTAPWWFYRYSIGLLPVSALLLAVMSRRLLSWNRLAGGALAAALLFTGLFHQLSAWPFGESRTMISDVGRTSPACDLLFPMGNYLFELAHPYRGPMEGLVAQMIASSRPGQRVLASYGDLVLMFYTGLEVRGGPSGRSLEGWPEPDWVVVRSFFRFVDRPELQADATRVQSWILDLPRAHYEDIPAPWTDHPWDDTPEPDLHWFRPPEGGAPMQVSRRRER